MPDHTIVTHDSPVLGCDDVVRMELDPSWDPVRWEDVATIVLPDGQRIVSCVPFFAANVHLGDVIEAVEDESTGGLVFVRRVARGQSWVFRIGSRDEAAFRVAHALIHEFDGAVETWEGITAVAIWGDAESDAFAGRLQQLENAGLLE